MSTKAARDRVAKLLAKGAKRKPRRGAAICPGTPGDVRLDADFVYTKEGEAAGRVPMGVRISSHVAAGSLKEGEKPA